MPKTVSIAPSWYWPAGVPRFCGIPPFGIDKLILQRAARERPEVALLSARKTSFTGKDLARSVAGLARRIGEASADDARLILTGAPSVPLVQFALGGIAASKPLEIVGGEGPAVLEVASRDTTERLDESSIEEVWRAGGEPLQSVAHSVGQPVLGWGGLEAYHSHSTLMAAAISLSLFYPEFKGAPIVVALSPTSWAWPATVLMSLYRLSHTLIGDPEDPLSSLGEGECVVVGDLEALGRVAREAKREVKAARGRVVAVIATIDGPFDPSSRKRLEKLLDCPVLTLLGSHDAGPVIGAHPSWYLAESAGIPVTNADVIPVDPRSREPIKTLWELVEYARITVHSPMVAAYRKAGDRFVHNLGNLADLGLLGSSDPNGMIYVMPG